MFHTWVLILVFFNSATAATSTTVPNFTDEASCVAAAKKVIASIPYVTVHYVCVKQP